MLSARLLSLSEQSNSHAHDHHQLVLSLTGRADFEVEGKGGEVCRMRACVVHGELDHAFAGLGNNQMLIVDLDEDDMSNDDRDVTARLFDLPRYPLLDADFQRLLIYAGTELSRYGSDLLLSRAISSILLRALHVRLFGEQTVSLRKCLDMEALERHVLTHLGGR
jgi:hypothetical protein